MGSRMIRDRSKESRWWLIVALFSICVVGWSLAFSFKATATESGVVQLASGADRVWNLTDFDRIKISGSPRVTLVQGDIERISANGDNDALEQLEVLVADGELIVRKKRGHWLKGWIGEPIELVIEFIDLERLKLSGATKLYVEELRSPTFSLGISGSGDTHIKQFQGDSLNLRVSGSATIDVGGAVNTQVIGISGSADYEARDLATQSTTIRISGSADAHVAVASTLDAKISGSGSVRYLGQPKVSSSVSGSGKIRPL